MKTAVSTWSLGSLLLAACAGDPPGFDTPESVLHDVAADVYLVSNLNGPPLQKNDSGYIARVRPDGGMQRYWIRGGRDGVTLHAPKGMALVGDVLWVADIDVVRSFDRRSGRPLGAVPIPGATFLNDVSAAPDGTLFVSDTGLDAAFEPTGTDAIWRLGADQVPAVLARGPELGQPNGLVARESGVYVVSWRDGSFYQIDHRGLRTDLGKAPTAQLDGLVRHERARDGRVEVDWYTTSWAGSCVYRIDLRGNFVALPQRLEQPADLGLDRQRGQLLVPLFGRHRLERLPL